MKIKFYILFFFLVAETGIAFSGSFVNGTMVHGGTTRKYVIYVPAIYVTQNKKVPLLVGLHGNGDVASNFSQICMSSIADTANYITVYPEALPDPNLGTNAWHSGAGVLGLFEVSSTVDDVGFINRLMDTVIAKYKIDTARMYVFGFSFGGFMTNKMAASNANRFSAAACVSGERGNYNTSIPAVPVPYLHFHGTADNVITYDGTGGSFPPLGLTPDNTTKFWATQNGCSLTPVIDTMPNLAADGLTFIRYTYNHSSNNNKAILYKVVNGTHSWYDRPTNDIDYCQTIWAFFRQYAKTSSSTPGTPTASFTASDTTVCVGNTLTFTSTSTSSSGSLDSIRWTILGGNPSTGTTSPITSTFNTVASYIITLKAYKSGNVSTITKSIRVKSKPTVIVTSPTICSGQTAQPIASGAASYTWTGGLTAVSNPSTPALTTTTTYTVTGTTNGCTNTAISTVTVKTNPTVTVTSPSICSGQTAQPLASGAASYTWTGGLTAVSNPSTPALTTTTTYTVTGTTNGCTNTAISTVTVKTNPTVTVTSPSICSGQTAQPLASGAASYTWTGSLAAVSNPVTPALTTTTTYTVTGTANGCTNTAISTVTVKVKPTVTVTSPTICSGQTAQPVASGAASYTWTGSLSAVSNPVTPALTTTTTYTVTGTTNGCTNTAISIVIVNALPATPTITKRNDSLLCSVTNGTSYKWYLNGTLFSATTVPKLKLTQNGNYTVEVIGTNACISFQSASFNATLTSVKNNRLDIQYSIVPNPNNGLFEIRLTAATNKIYQLRMYNISGQTIISEGMNVKAGQNSKQINVSGIEKGVYFLSLIGDDGISTQNISIQ